MFFFDIYKKFCTFDAELVVMEIVASVVRQFDNSVDTI